VTYEAPAENDPPSVTRVLGVPAAWIAEARVSSRVVACSARALRRGSGAAILRSHRSPRPLLAPDAAERVGSTHHAARFAQRIDSGEVWVKWLPGDDGFEGSQQCHALLPEG
jgi:hypothetical protein